MYTSICECNNCSFAHSVANYHFHITPAAKRCTEEEPYLQFAKCQNFPLPFRLMVKYTVEPRYLFRGSAKNRQDPGKRSIRENEKCINKIHICLDDE